VTYQLVIKYLVQLSVTCHGSAHVVPCGAGHLWFIL